MDKVIDYNKLALLINSNNYKILEEYYNDFIPDENISLKFRFIKVFVLDLDNKQTKWILLHKFVNRHRITIKNLKISILKLFDSNIIPIRIFYSVSQWLSPEKVSRNKGRQISSGFMVFENDDSILQSIKTAQLLHSYLSGKKINVFSGNKSIHTWWFGFNIRNYIDITDNKLWKNYEYYDKHARKVAANIIQNKLHISIDVRAAVDSRRVVPIINTINGFTGKKVTLIDDVNNIDFQKLNNQLPGWINS